MVEGRSNQPFPMIQKLVQEQPKLLHTLLNTLAESVCLHLNAQIKAGVQAVMVFDTWGGLLPTESYQEYSLRYIQQIRAGLLLEHNGQRIPFILFTKNGGQWLEMMMQAGCDVLGVDWQVHLGEARARIHNKAALQGNMNPVILSQTPEHITAEVQRILREYGKGPGHIFNLGHGITPDIPPENVAVLVDAVHAFSREYHQ